MSIFQNSVLTKYIRLHKPKIQAAYKIFKKSFLNAAKQENIRCSKEEQYQEGFLRDLFVDVFGYVLNPEPNFNLISEKKNETNAKKADGAILVKDTVKAVIELKGCDTTDLKNIEGQAFGYKNNHRNVSYVITSNYQKLRFYIDNTIDFREWDLFSLTEEGFSELWLCLCYENLASDLPKKIKEESVSCEDQITKQFYQDYSNFKKDLFADLTSKNTSIDKLTLFKNSQKLLDRLLFIFFAEDSGLLEPNTIVTIIERWEKLKKLDAYFPLYERFKKYFEYLNTGYKDDTLSVFGYNGGLFKADEILDSLSISDEILEKYTRRLSEYDFKSDVDVNILGHIFEHSLSEIENITKELTTNEVAISKRKKDGVFYTPKYITTYIVENTIGKLCREKKQELQINETEYFTDKRRIKRTRTALTQKLDDYREWLFSLSICDPACGSGAFLNAALDFLICEHRLIDEMIAKLFGYQIVYSEYENDILEKNLYGVDINDESVEIAKLSLWLKTAKPERKLNSLNNNIKCGNSLISDPKVAGDKAFDWHKEFPHVFEKGGFDVVIGNPPYVRLESIKDASELLAKSGYSTFDKRGDLYCLFVERGFDLLKEQGFISYIMPNKWMQAGYGKSLREYLLTKELIRLIDFGDIQIFEGATTYPCIFVSKNAEPKDRFDVSVLNAASPVDFYTNVRLTRESFETKQFSDDTWVISSRNDKHLLERLQNQFPTLEKFINGEANYGIKFGLTEAFVIDAEKKDELVSQDSKSGEIIGPLLRGRDIKRYSNEFVDSYLITTFPSLKIDIDTYPAVKQHLLTFDYNRLKQTGEKGSRKKTNNKWFETQDTIAYWELFSKPKIMYQTFQVKPCFIYDDTGLFCNNSMWIIPTENKALLAILNSKMGWWLISKFCTQIQNGYQLIWKYFGQIPTPTIQPKELEKSVDQMLLLNADLQTKRQRFLKRLADNFDGIKINTALSQFDAMDFKQILAELKKQKINLSLKQQDEWEEYFNDSKQKCQSLVGQIQSTDQEIDQMVYQLYGLSNEEIELIENS
jgi:Type I restriction-modification system methyltransferase subunit